ncbi:DUF4426 domain-containing protein [Caldimonas tepidiphila]|uniref:DUF4426 domain-containing protein n=1 Tax=Caldimonas tepidiphila TaxID=2315841 RepID=UPI0013008322|nr:DUF4426 domain-containing protein [Caldimonas tepidiphila]
MSLSIPALTPAARPLAALLLSLSLAGPAWSQAHTQRFGAYTLQSSSVNSEALAAETAREHGIEPAPGRAVLNVVVLKDEQGASRTVPARVQARVTSLAGAIEEVPMRETRAQGRVAYTGTYTILPRQVFDITVTARPQGSDEDLTMSYRERMWAGTGPNSTR